MTTRKYISEFGLHTYAGYRLLLQQDHLDRVKAPLINKIIKFHLLVVIMTMHEARGSAAAEVRVGLADVGRTDATPDGGE